MDIIARNFMADITVDIGHKIPGNNIHEVKHRGPGAEDGDENAAADDQSKQSQ